MDGFAARREEPLERFEARTTRLTARRDDDAGETWVAIGSDSTEDAGGDGGERDECATREGEGEWR